MKEVYHYMSAVTQPRAAQRDHWSLVGVAAVLAFVAMLDMSVATVAVNDIGAALSVPPQDAQWAVLGYQLAVVALLLPAGRWLDGVGLRAALVGSVSVFACCAAFAAAAPSLAWLIAARILQGAAGSALFVLMPVLAASSVRPEYRARAMSVPATAGPLGAVLGPAIGGIALDHWGWRAVFLLKLPLCIVALVVSWRSAPRGGRMSRPTPAMLRDVALIAFAVAALLLALTFGTDSPVWLVLGVLAIPAIAWWLTRDSGRWAHTTLTSGRVWPVAASVLALALAFAAMRYLVVLHLQHDRGATATAAGLTVVAFSLAMAFAGPLGGRLADRFGRKPTAVAGAGLMALGMLLLLTPSTWSPWDLGWRMAIAGLGMGLNGGPAQLWLVTSAGTERMATAGAVSQFAKLLGFALGPALATTAWGLTGGGATGTSIGLVLAVLGAVAATALLACARRPKVITTAT